jgi:hypothetical protein
MQHRHRAEMLEKQGPQSAQKFSLGTFFFQEKGSCQL